jgi:ferric-chelate reductase (NADPH)
MTETASEKKSLGSFEGVISKLFTKAAVVHAIDDVADGFRLLTLTGEALRGVAWTPGQKVQLMLGGWVQRTFTPMSWDGVAGSTQILAYMHGDGPAAAWARGRSVGDGCAIFGPRGSLDLNRLERPALLFGDETSFGLAYALRFTPATQNGVELLLEVNSTQAGTVALAAIGVSGAHLIERRADEQHLGEVHERTVQLLQTGSIRGGVLSGKATSIQHMTKQLRQLGLPRGQLQTKAYWAPGKTGLD